MPWGGERFYPMFLAIGTSKARKNASVGPKSRPFSGHFVIFRGVCFADFGNSRLSQ